MFKILIKIVKFIHFCTSCMKPIHDVQIFCNNFAEMFIMIFIYNYLPLFKVQLFKAKIIVLMISIAVLCK